MYNRSEIRMALNMAKASGIDFNDYHCTTCDGKTLSGQNAFLCELQLGEPALVVGGFRQWRKSGRKVRKGGRALAIYIPSRKKATATANTDAETNEDESSEETARQAATQHFLIGMVFAATDTEPLDAQATTESAE